MSIERVKKEVGYRAAKELSDGMLIGLGSGSTAEYFIEALIQRHKEGFAIRAVASSEKSLQLARKGGIPLIDINTITRVDLTVDGADHISPSKEMIKGAGAAFVREKILASMSRDMLVIIDETKLVSSLGGHKLPVEILPFAHLATVHAIENLGYFGEMRKGDNGSFYVTDNGNYIIDLNLARKIDPRKTHREIVTLPGVVDTGFFFDLAGKVLVGFLDGQIVDYP